ncbi:MAG: iron-sulfur cluster assembly scaffold protein [Alphaproteobacteria bacterium]|nr:iron-sulfur cluster assembly scaffold protein [Alphaproteobacteria bacterium]
MNDAIYQRALLALAAGAAGAGRLAEPSATARADNPICGDRCTIDVALDAEGTITALAHDTKACVLAQASAAILGAHAVGANGAAITALKEDVLRMLKEAAAPPAPPFAEFSALEPAAAHKSRHACVLLPLEALLKALDRG